MKWEKIPTLKASWKFPGEETITNSSVLKSINFALEFYWVTNFVDFGRKLFISFNSQWFIWSQQYWLMLQYPCNDYLSHVYKVIKIYKSVRFSDSGYKLYQVLGCQASHNWITPTSHTHTQLFTYLPTYYDAKWVINKIRK